MMRSPARHAHRDSITLRLTRAEIGDCLGMTVESVSRALSRLAARQADRVRAEVGRREIAIPDAGALSAYVQASVAPTAPTLRSGRPVPGPVRRATAGAAPRHHHD